MSPKRTALSVVKQFQSETDALREAPEPWSARITVFVLAGFLLSCVAIMFLMRLDRTITSLAGKIVSSQQVNVFQALDPSIIKSIDVREGDQVRPGQLLATLDPTFAGADVAQLRSQRANLEAQIARDKAELDGQPLVFPVSADPEFAKYAALQQALYDQRAAQYAAQIKSYDAKISLTQATIEKYKGDEARYKQREEVAKKIEDMRTILAEHGTGSQLNLYVSQDVRLDLMRNLEFGHNSLLEAEHTLASNKADRDAFIQQWSGALSQELLKARNDLDAARSQLDKAEKRQDLVRLTASEPSVVLTLAKLSAGSVLKQGDTLFTLMPSNAPLEAEFSISSRDVGFVRAGDHCALKVDAFNYIEHGTAEGTVRWISDNAFTTDDNGQAAPAYYKARCGIDVMHFTNVPANFRLIPGMTLSVDIKVGTRSVAMYLLSGMLRGMDEAMREP